MSYKTSFIWTAQRFYRAVMICFLTVFSLQCSKPATKTDARTTGSNNANLSAKCSGSSTSAASEGCKGSSDEVLEDEGDRAPDPAKVVDGTELNNNKPNIPAKPKEDADKILIAQRVSAYRPIWLDLSHDDSFKASNRVFGTSSLEGHSVMQLSIYQPLTTFADINHDRGDEFYTLGHAIGGLENKLTWPNCPTSVISYYEPLPKGKVPLLPPTGYTRVFYKQGNRSQEYLNRCKKAQEAQMQQKYADPADMKACDVFDGGNMGFSFENLRGSFETYFQSFFEKQNVTVWRGIPPEGYHCLGDIATNQQTQPMFASDYAGVNATEERTADGFDIYSKMGIKIGEQQGRSFYKEAALYCVKDEFLTEGKLYPVIHNTEVIISYIVGKEDITPASGTPTINDPLGYGASHLFHVYKKPKLDMSEGEILSALNAVKPMVLNRKFIKIIGDRIDKELEFSKCPLKDTLNSP